MKTFRVLFKADWLGRHKVIEFVARTYYEAKGTLIFLPEEANSGDLGRVAHGEWTCVKEVKEKAKE